MSAQQADAQVSDVSSAHSTSPWRERRGTGRQLPGWVVPSLPAVAELAIGGYRIGGPSLWRDEAATIVGSRRPVGAIFALVRNADAVHGPYYLLMHFVILFGGTSETVLRLPSLVAMSGAAALTAVLARRLARATGLPAPSATGLLAGLALTAVPLTTRYAQEARPYALTSLFAVLATYLLVRAAGSGRWSWWASYAAAIALTGLFNLFAVLLALAHGVSLLAATQYAHAQATGPGHAAQPEHTAEPAQATGPTEPTVAAGQPAAGVAAAGVAADPADAIRPAEQAIGQGSDDAADQLRRADEAGIDNPCDLNHTVGLNHTAGLNAPAGQTQVDGDLPRADRTAGLNYTAGLNHTTDVGKPAEQVVAGSVMRWLVACVVAAVVLSPMTVLSLGQSAQLSWVATPDLSTVATLVRDFAGAVLLIPVVAVLAGLGCAAGRGIRHGTGLTVAAVTVPWLVLPPVLLLAVSLVHPVYVERYVVFCLPALAVLVAAGLTWLVHLTRAALRPPDTVPGWPVRAAAFAPSVLLAVIMAAGLTGPQRAVRLATARTDDLRAVATTVAANERPGDAIVYLPWDTAMAAQAYPAPFQRLRDIELRSSPVASATLRGLEAPASVVARRLSDTSRVWTVQWAQQLGPLRLTRTDVAARTAVAGMRLIRRWHIESVILSLYEAR